MPSHLAVRVQAVRQAIEEAAAVSGRSGSQVRILAATKTRTVAEIAQLAEAGVELIGENRAQELVAKSDELAELPAPPQVHFIGRLQRNKVTAVVPRVSCIQSVDSPALAAAIAKRVTDMDVMIQVNTSGQPQQGGVAPPEVVEFAAAIGAMPQLHLVGLMTIGSMTDPERSFELLRDLRDEALASGAPGTADTQELSMGMSGDFQAAVRQGATMVRLGSSLFGPR